MSSVKKNYLYNVAYEILVMILPLITLPYISRIIGPTGTGIYSYAYTIATYFVLLANLGLKNYGNRSIAKTRDNKQKMSMTFKSIYIFQMLYSIFVSIIYFIFCTFVINENIKISLIFGIYVLSSIIDINWMLYGLEKFKLTLIRNLVIKILSTILIFTFVKSSNDLWLYCLIISFSAFLSQLSLWPIIIKELDLSVKIDAKDVLKNIKPLFILFIPVVSTSIYRGMDKIMLANLFQYDFVGQYEYADKIIYFPTVIITSLGFVLIPKISNLISKGKKEETTKYLNISMEFSIMISIAFSFGILSVSDNFIPLFLGEEYKMAGVILQILSPSIIFIAVGNTIKTQYLIPNERDKEFVIAVVSGAIVNLLLNFLLIPKYGAYGAAFATLTSEIVVGIYQLLSVKSEINYKLYIKYLLKYLIYGFIMLIFVNLFRLIISNNIILILLQILFGAIIYLALTYNFWKNYINKKVILKFVNKIKKTS